MPKPSAKAGALPPSPAPQPTQHLYARPANGAAAPAQAELPAVRKALAEQLGDDAKLFDKLTQGNTFDAQLDSAVRRWQSGLGIVADGVIGPRCLTLLGLRTPGAFEVTLENATVLPLFPATKPANISRYLPYVAAALAACGLTDRAMVCAALGTIRAETEGFVPISEYVSRFNTQPGGLPYGIYDDMKGLGNQGAGDGALFKGRGFVQLTGRANYKNYGPKLGLDLIAQPDWANAPEVAAMLLALFLQNCQEKMRAALAKGDYKAARKLINGGSHGLDSFSSVFELAQKNWPAPLAAAAVPGRASAKRPSTKTRAAKASAQAEATKQAPSRNAKKDAADLRDRPYTPPPINLRPAFPTDAEIETWLPRYSASGAILDQGQEGACTGFGLACVINFMRWREAGAPEGKHESVSARMLYNFARRYDEWEGEDYDGSTCRGAIKGWYNHGVCLESDWPYGVPGARPRYGYAQRAAQQSLGVYYRVELTAITDMQAAIQSVGAIYVSACTHAGWGDLPELTKPPKGHQQLPVIPFDAKYEQAGGHAFAMVGYNAHGFVFQNSWGDDWGAGGFAVLSYADWLANGMDAWVVALGVPGVMAGRLGASAAAAAPAGSAGAGSGYDPYRRSIIWGNNGRVTRYLTEDEPSRSLQYAVAGQAAEWYQKRYPSPQKGQQTEPLRLVIYAHGGLNTEADAIKRAKVLGPCLEANDCFPLFLIWKTGILESLGDCISDAWEAQRKQARAGSSLLERASDEWDRLIEATLGQHFARPIWSEIKSNAALAFEQGRGGDLLIQALQTLADTFGERLELHLVGHSAGSILLGHLLSRMRSLCRPGATPLPVQGIHLYAPACSVAFANQHYASHPELMKRLYIDLLSDRMERNDNVASIYRKSLLYLVSNTLETDPRTPLLGLANSLDPNYKGWDGSSNTAEALSLWRRAAEEAELTLGGERLTVVDLDRVPTATAPKKIEIPAAHGNFDNDVSTLNRTLERILGHAPQQPVADLRGY